MAWVIDLDGVIWLDDRPVPGAAEAVAELRSRGEDVVFVTNNSSRPIRHYEQKLAGFGIEAQGEVISSAIVAASLVEPDEVALVCGGPGLEEALEERGVHTVHDGDADVVVVGYHRDFDYGRMTAASTAVHRGARLLATNDDPTYPTASGPLPGAGAILASVVTATGVTPVVAGKPNRPAADLVRSRVGDRGTVVGDRPDTDGRFALALGFEFALVLSGVTGAEDLPVRPEPDVVAADLAVLVGERR